MRAYESKVATMRSGSNYRFFRGLFSARASYSMFSSNYHRGGAGLIV
jgi:hypothetical protein